MFHSCLLLCRLPQLTISPSWSHRWLVDLPLQEVLQQDPDGTQRFPLRYLLSDIVKWDQHKRCFLLRQHRLWTLFGIQNWEHPIISSFWHPLVVFLSKKYSSCTTLAPYTTSRYHLATITFPLVNCCFDKYHMSSITPFLNQTSSHLAP